MKLAPIIKNAKNFLLQINRTKYIGEEEIKSARVCEKSKQ